MQTCSELRLGAERDAAARARRFLASALAGEEVGVLDDAALIVTELVTNAQLHGAEPILVRVRHDGGRVRLEVEDRGRQMLMLPGGSTEAMTGRGLALVGALAGAWGVAPQDGGKVVWAALAGEGDDQPRPPLDLAALLESWPDEEATEPEFTVRLGSVPTDLLLEAKRHIDNVVREFTLEQASGTDNPLPPGLQALIDTVTTEFAAARAAIKRQAVSAAARGDVETELVLRLPASAALAGEHYLAALDEADRHSRAARLLTLESPPLHRVFRTWYVQALVDELRARAAGRAVPTSRTFVQVLGDEVTALSGLRETASRLGLLQKVNGDLAAATTSMQMADIVVRTALASLEARSARVYVVEEHGAHSSLRSLVAHGGSPEWVAPYEVLAVDADLPGPVVFRSGRPMLLRNLAQIAERFPELSQVQAVDHSLHIVPLVVGAHRLGVLSLAFPVGGTFDEDTRGRFVQALADALAQALQRAQAMAEAAAAADRLAFPSHRGADGDGGAG